jgi:hypothetical protein
MARLSHWLMLLGSVGLVPTVALAASTGNVEIRVVDSKTGDLIPCRMHLKDQNGKPVKVPKTIAWNDHFLVPGKVVLSLKPGAYTFEMERGPEYKLRTGNFLIERNATDNKTVDMVRFVDMQKEGWWSGDLHVHRPPADMTLLMQAEDLHVAPVITWNNKTNLWDKKPLPAPALVPVEGQRFYQLLGGEDERAGGGLLLFNLPKPLDMSAATAEFPSSADLLAMAKKSSDQVLAVANNPFCWDLPVWVVAGQLDSVNVCHDYLQRDSLLTKITAGRPFDKEKYPNPDAVGRWTLDIYYHLLNCGLRLPPSAGSGSGEAANPLGYNRTYVHCGEDFTYDKWCAGLKAGRVVITNGPLIRPLANDQLPGHVFAAGKGETVELTIALNLSLREKVDYLEIVQDGKVVHEVRLDKFAAANGMLPPIKFEKSGWLLVRAVTNHPKTFRFAMTAPWYVEIGYEPRISKKSAQFFVDWVFERATQLKFDDPAHRASVLAYHRAARDFWQKRLESANAE